MRLRAGVGAFFGGEDLCFAVRITCLKGGVDGGKKGCCGWIFGGNRALAMPFACFKNELWVENSYCGNFKTMCCEKQNRK